MSAAAPPQNFAASVRLFAAAAEASSNAAAAKAALRSKVLASSGLFLKKGACIV